MPSSAWSPHPLSPLSLHDALPICSDSVTGRRWLSRNSTTSPSFFFGKGPLIELREITSELLLAQPHLPESLLQDSLDSQEFRVARRSEEHTSELQSPDHLVCRLLLGPPTLSPLFPYTTLFRSARIPSQGGVGYREIRLPHRASSSEKVR